MKIAIRHGGFNADNIEKIKSPELWSFSVSGSRLELPSASADMKPMLRLKNKSPDFWSFSVSGSRLELPTFGL